MVSNTKVGGARRLRYFLRAGHQRNHLYLARLRISLESSADVRRRSDSAQYHSQRSMAGGSIAKLDYSRFDRQEFAQWLYAAVEPGHPAAVGLEHGPRCVLFRLRRG